MDYLEENVRRLRNKAAKRYDKAQKNIDARMKRYLRANQKTADTLMARVSDKEISEREFKQQMQRELFRGKKWNREREQIAEILYRANVECTEDMNECMDEVFIESYNRESFKTEKHYLRDMGFALLTREALKLLQKQGKVTIPYKTVNREKDMQWNIKRIQNEVTNSIEIGKGLLAIGKNAVQGLSHKGLSDIDRVTEYTMRSVRAMGEYESMLEAEKLGIEIEKQWIATLDDHTRDTHRDLDGQTVPLHEPFEVDGYEIMYPRDPSAEPEMIINCRCTMKRIYPKYNNVAKERTENIRAYPNPDNPFPDRPERRIIPNMTYREWEKWK